MVLGRTFQHTLFFLVKRVTFLKTYKLNAYNFLAISITIQLGRLWHRLPLIRTPALHTYNVQLCEWPHNPKVGHIFSLRRHYYNNIMNVSPYLYNGICVLHITSGTTAVPDIIITALIQNIIYLFKNIFHVLVCAPLKGKRVSSLSRRNDNNIIRKYI